MAGIYVKVLDSVEIPFEDGVESAFGPGVWDGAWALLTPGLTPPSLLRATDAVDAQTLADTTDRLRTEAADPTLPDLTKYFRVDLDEGLDAEAVAEGLSAVPGIEYAEVAPDAVESVNRAANPLAATQGYLDAAPAGVDADFAWQFPGGDGSSVHVILLDVFPYDTTHPDLPGSVTLFSQGNPSFTAAEQAHGTAALGVLAAVDNTQDLVGIVPEAAFDFISLVPFRNGAKQPADFQFGLLLAATQAQRGDVIVSPTSRGDAQLLPHEATRAANQLMGALTRAGVTVVIAAGNRGTNLDTVTSPLPLNRANPAANFVDSGAIVVGGGFADQTSNPTTPFPSAGFNHGSRVDCFAWGSNVEALIPVALGSTTTGVGNFPPGHFNGTSSASSIVGAVAACIQSLAIANLGSPLPPGFVRTGLSSPFNTAAAPGVTDIGVMPDLAAVKNALVP